MGVIKNDKKIKQSILLKNTFIYMITSVFNSLVPFLISPILKTYLSPLDYGIRSTGTDTVAIMAVYIRLSMIGGVNILLSYILIKLNGTVGAVQATTIPFFITFIIVWRLSAKVYSMPWRLK